MRFWALLSRSPASSCRRWDRLVGSPGFGEGRRLLPPGSRAECECLLAAFLTARSVAGVIQRRAEASAATETTMKRKRSLKNSPFINQLNCR